MEIVRIFAENLFAFKFEGESYDEFERLFDLWHDTEYLEGFFDEHQEDLESGYWNTISIEESIIETINEARALESDFRNIADKSDQEKESFFHDTFIPLIKSDLTYEDLGKSKARRRWLRIYALKVENSVYIVTGGAIKLTAKMSDRKHTSDELTKLERCRDYLIENGIVDADGLIEECEL
jgi:hypothetical protein